MKARTVLFVCTGNYYRSRFAEILFNHLAENEGHRWRAESRGLQTWLTVGMGISDHTVEGLAARGIEVNGDGRDPIQLSEEDLETAGLVVAVKEAEHRAMFDELFPDWADRVEYWHVDDLDCAVPCDALACLEAEVRGLLRRLK